MVSCPDGHENMSGLSYCKTCGLPLLNLRAEFSSLTENFASRADMGRPRPRTILVGLGTTGAGLIDIASATHVVSFREHSYLAIDADGASAQVRCENLLRLTLGGSTPSAATFCGIGEELMRNDPLLLPSLRKAGLGQNNRDQIVLLVSAVGGGIGSAASVLISKCRQLNSTCCVIGLVVIPGSDESFHNWLNAYYGLSRMLETGTGHTADVIITTNYDQLKKLRGVGSGGEELKTEGLLVSLSELLIKNLSSDRIAEVIRINQSLGVKVVVPCFAMGRSLEIFGSLGNILESAIDFPANNFSKQTILVCHLFLQIPKNQTVNFGEDKVNEELSALLREHLPNVKSTSLSITVSEKQHDRVDACLLLGGDLAINLLFADESSHIRFKEEMSMQASWETYGLKFEDVEQAGEVLMKHTFLPDQGRGERKEGQKVKSILSDAVSPVAKEHLEYSSVGPDIASKDEVYSTSTNVRKSRTSRSKKSSKSNQ